MTQLELPLCYHDGLIRSIGEQDWNFDFHIKEWCLDCGQVFNEFMAPRESFYDWVNDRLSFEQLLQVSKPYIPV
jgi:hypothetical protein